MLTVVPLALGLQKHNMVEVRGPGKRKATEMA